MWEHLLDFEIQRRTPTYIVKDVMTAEPTKALPTRVSHSPFCGLSHFTHAHLRRTLRFRLRPAPSVRDSAFQRPQADVTVAGKSTLTYLLAGDDKWMFSALCRWLPALGGGGDTCFCVWYPDASAATNAPHSSGTGHSDDGDVFRMTLLVVARLFIASLLCCLR